MATPKPGIPDYYWLVHANELYALAVPDLVLAETLKSLAFYLDVELINTDVFCAAPQAHYVDLTIEDFYNGAYLDKLKAASRQTVFFNICEEV